MARGKPKRKPWPLLVFGLLALAVVIIVLFGIEKDFAMRRAALGDAARQVVTIDPQVPSSTTEGALVHLVGDARAPQGVRDPLFGIAIDGLRLVREVEMLQWQETVEGAGADASVFYDRIWSAARIDSDRFRDPLGRRNPRVFPLSALSVEADGASLGAFALDPAVIASAEADRAPPVEPGATLEGGGFELVEQVGWFVHARPGEPEIGDVRVRFRYVPAGRTTVAGMQTADRRLVPWPAPDGAMVGLLRPGEFDAAALLGDQMRLDWLANWQMRAGLAFASLIGFICVAMGGALLARHQGRQLRRLLLFAASCAAGLLAVVAAAAWAPYLPVYGVAMAVLGAALLVMGHRATR